MNRRMSENGGENAALYHLVSSYWMYSINLHQLIVLFIPESEKKDIFSVFLPADAAETLDVLAIS